MDTFLKLCAAVIIAAILNLILSNYRKDVGTLLCIIVCCMIGVFAIRYFQPVFDFFMHLKDVGKLDNALFSTLLKCVGIGLLSDITSSICNDAGNGSMGKALQLLATAIILSLSVPLFERLLSLVQEILISL